jgi:hypothetical protein
MSNRNGKTQRSRVGPAVESTALALPQITRAQANEILKGRAVELYHDARSLPNSTSSAGLRPNTVAPIVSTQRS